MIDLMFSYYYNKMLARVSGWCDCGSAALGAIEASFEISGGVFESRIRFRSRIPVEFKTPRTKMANVAPIDQSSIFQTQRRHAPRIMLR